MGAALLRDGTRDQAGGRGFEDLFSLGPVGLVLDKVLDKHCASEAFEYIDPTALEQYGHPAFHSAGTAERDQRSTEVCPGELGSRV